MIKQPSDMLTADELEALRRSAKSQAAYFRLAFGRLQSAQEIAWECQGNKWWDNHLRQMREEETKQGKG